MYGQDSLRPRAKQLISRRIFATQAESSSAPADPVVHEESDRDEIHSPYRPRLALKSLLSCSSLNALQTQIIRGFFTFKTVQESMSKLPQKPGRAIYLKHQQIHLLRKNLNINLDFSLFKFSLHSCNIFHHTIAFC